MKSNQNPIYYKACKEASSQLECMKTLYHELVIGSTINSPEIIAFQVLLNFFENKCKAYKIKYVKDIYNNTTQHTNADLMYWLEEILNNE